ncbi:flagellar hook protein FlgE [Rhizobium sp. 2YAF20]|uniref:flagellar hook protein FlgE n=1 Tax=Rhizobium sp. 2YAF20 TaxID=3233027 RepID=UPI003F990F7F
MSIFGSMKTAVSGMNAQANRLGTVSDNIANSSTTGYKEATTSFSSLVLPQGSGNYNSGGVETTIQYAISQQGNISYTTSTNDLAIQGSGFFVVSDAAGTPYMTRAGNFAPDSSGNLVNSAGFTLMGYSYGSGSPSVVVNGFNGLVPINVNQTGLTAVASTSGNLAGNLNSNDTAVTTAANVASANNSTATPSEKSSVVGYDSQGNAITYDVYYTKTAANTWDVAVYNHADATAGNTPFPYTPAASAFLGGGTMVFNANGQLTTTGTITPTAPLTVNPTAPQPIKIDMSGFTQLASGFTATGKVNGQAPNPVKSVTIGKDGTVSALYGDGSSKNLYRIPLATVASPDLLTLQSGNVYSANGQSGVTVTGFPQTGQFGYVQSGALEESNVDLASELTNMIEAQKSYTANSKVFQAGSELMDVLVNLQR